MSRFVLWVSSLNLTFHSQRKPSLLHACEWLELRTQRLFVFSDTFEFWFSIPSHILGSPFPLSFTHFFVRASPGLQRERTPWPRAGVLAQVWPLQPGPATIPGCRWSRPHLPAGRCQEFSLAVAFMQIFCYFWCLHCVVRYERSVLWDSLVHPWALCIRSSENGISYFPERVRRLTKEREDPLLWDDQNAALPFSREQRLSLIWSI